MMLRRREKRRYLAIAINKDELIDVLRDPKYLPHAGYSNGLKKYEKKDFEIKKGVHETYSKILLKIIKRRYSDLFGFIALEKSGIQILTGKKIKFEGIFILKYHLESVNEILFTLAMCNRPIVTTLKMSGTIRSLISGIESILPVFKNT